MPDIVMPRLSDSMEEGTIIRWLKTDGEQVRRGEELVEIETDKANMTYEADEEGILKIVAAQGDTLPVGGKIAEVGEPSSSLAAQSEAEGQPEAAAQREPGAQPEEAAQPEETAQPEEAARPEGAAQPDQDVRAPETEQAPEGAGGTGNGRTKASPLARRIARERGVELAALSGSGPGGRIVKADVEAALTGAQAAWGAEPVADERGSAEPVADERGGAEPTADERGGGAQPAEAQAEPASAKGKVTRVELTRLQQLVARRMAESRATVPSFELQMEIDMEDAAALREQLKAHAGEQDVVPSLNDMIVKACALALRRFPRANGAYRDGHFELYERINVGVAVAATDALVVPTIFDADGKSLGQIAREARTLAQRVRDRTITPPELSGGTFTVSNLGMFGITSFTAVINPPQAAILAIGAVEPKAVVYEGAIRARRRMGVTLACDHRILYGADAAEFLGAVRELLENPLRLTF